MAAGGVTLYHNPRCSKSRQALSLLRERGVEPDVVEYLKAPLSPGAVKDLVVALGISAHDLLRCKEKPYAEEGLSSQSSLEEIAAAVSRHPILMERPVAVAGATAVLGRPPERVLELL